MQLKVTEAQGVKLKKQLDYVVSKSAFYKKKFDGEDLTSFESLPFTTKDDLAHFNDDFLCIPKNKVRDIVTTSGTLGNAVTFYLSKNDLERLALNEEQALRVGGCKPGDLFQLLTTMDKQFMAGLAYYLGIQKLDAGIVRLGPCSPQAQWDAILKHCPTVLISVPSFLPKLIAFAEKEGINLSETSVERIICIGEPIRKVDFELNDLGKHITDKWPIQLISTYASTEMGAAFTECTHGKGGHLNPDLLVLEVVDEEGKAVASGEMGEVVVTPLDIEATPLIRYKTGDLCHVYYETCSCGNATPRLGPVVGRKQQMIKYKGTTIFPSAIENVLAGLGIELYQISILKNELDMDTVQIALTNDWEEASNKELVLTNLQARLRVTPELHFLEKEVLFSKVFKNDKRKPLKIVVA